jgi:SAM-dependent methyltransferase
MGAVLESALALVRLAAETAAAMWSDVVDLRDFYASPLGRTARRLIDARLQEIWPDAAGQAVLGLGYAVPYLRNWRGNAARCLAMMPAPQGVLHWPPEGPNATSLVEEEALPLPDMSVDRVLLVHAIEHAESLRPFLREVWRVLSGSGRVLIVVPNRRGIWARLDHTPFGHGHPYTSGQLQRLLRDNLFVPQQTRNCLFVPPLSGSLWLSSARAWERAGARLFPALAGVTIVEASKTLYAPAPTRARARAVPAAAELARAR